jgi:hypothetical protein
VPALRKNCVRSGYPHGRVRYRRIVLALGFAGILATAPSSAAPEIFVWAWERPEDLTTVDPSVGVAFLAQTVIVSAGQVAIVPRQQPLRVTPGARVIAVTRIEATSGAIATSANAREQIAAAVARTVRLPRVLGVQIDFDARSSERPFYRALVHDIRGRIGRRATLSMTALASWCTGDRWLDTLPVDEIVPAIFRMGHGQPYRRLGAVAAWPAPECGRAVGISLDEPVSVRAAGRRVYVFSPARWDAASIAAARRFVTP